MAGAQFDLREEVGGIGKVERSFGLIGIQAGEGGGHIGGLGVAEADRHVGDAVRGASEGID